MTASAWAITRSPELSYLARAVAAVACAGLLLGSARTHGPLALSRRLLGLAVLSGALSGVLAAVSTAATGRAAQLGGPSDWVNLAAYVPFAAGGLLAVPTRPGARLRTLADGVLAAGSLWYVAQVVLIEPEQLDRRLHPFPWLVSVGYVLLPVFVVAVLLSVLPSASPGARPFLLRSGAGLMALVVSEVAYAVATWHGTYHPTGWVALVNDAGILLLLAVAVGTRTPLAVPIEREPAVPESRGAPALLPYLALVAAGATAVSEFAAGGTYTHAEMLPCLVIGASFLVRHAASLYEHRELVGELGRREEQARAGAARDPLTGLPNRAAFLAALGELLDDADAHPVAVALVDLNDFKDINDTHGHAVGDEVLHASARALRSALPAPALVARLGGDEFAVCAPAVADGGQGLVEAVLAAYAAPMPVGPRRFTIRPSVGVVLDERPRGVSCAGDAGYLLAHADVAMYQAKAEKEVRPAPAVILTGASRTKAASLLRLREQISDPDLDQFRLAYQPVVDLATGGTVGVEALLRWRHPELGEIPPAQFVPLAEQVGSVGRLGDFTFDTALAALARWQAHGVFLQLGVNLSPRQLADDTLPQRVLDLLARHGVPPQRLIMEITEGALMRDFDVAVRLVGQLRDAGIAVAVDDFGTGYSSLRYLRRFPANILKIDREFIQATPHEPRTAALVRSVVQMATALGLDTVAEGIETGEQLSAARALGCVYGQGYLFSRPLPAEALLSYVLPASAVPAPRTGTADVRI